MMHYQPTAQDILSSLPREQRNELLLLIETTPGDAPAWLPRKLPGRAD
jgi:hypothetical protein